MELREFIITLRALADCVEKTNVSNTGPYQLLPYSAVIDGVNCVFKMQYSPFYIRLRADRLSKIKLAKGDKRSLEVFRAINHKTPTLRRARFSKRIAAQFLQDGELMNYHNYIGLYT